MDINSRLAALAAAPKPFACLVTYRDGRVRRVPALTQGAAENCADRERRKIGRELLEVGTNRPVCVVAVEVTSNREAVAREYKATIGYDPFAEGWTLAEAEETLAEYRAEERKAIFGV